MNNTNNCNNSSVVVDNNVLMDLFELERLDILFEVFNNVIIPQIIYNEEIIDKVKIKLEKHEYILKNINTEIGMEMYGLLNNKHEFRNLSTHDNL